MIKFYTRFENQLFNYWCSQNLGHVDCASAARNDAAYLKAKQEYHMAKLESLVIAAFGCRSQQSPRVSQVLPPPGR